MARLLPHRRRPFRGSRAPGSWQAALGYLRRVLRRCAGLAGIWDGPDLETLRMSASAARPARCQTGPSVCPDSLPPTGSSGRGRKGGRTGLVASISGSPADRRMTAHFVFLPSRPVANFNTWSPLAARASTLIGRSCGLQLDLAWLETLCL